MGLTKKRKKSVPDGPPSSAPLLASAPILQSDQEDVSSRSVEGVEMVAQPKRRWSSHARLMAVEDEDVAESEVSDDGAKTKVTRPDVSERRKANKEIDCFSMKKRLSGFCKPEVRQFDWDGAVRAVNQAVAEAYALGEFYVLQQLEGIRSIANIDQTFYQPCLSLVTNEGRSLRGLRENFKIEQPKLAQADQASGVVDSAFLEWVARRHPPKNDLEKAGHAFMELQGEHPSADTAYLNQSCFPPSAKQMATNAQNAVVRTFAKRLFVYVLHVQVEPLDQLIRDGLDQHEIEQEITKRMDEAISKNRKPPSISKLRKDITEQKVRAAKKKRTSAIVNGVFAKKYTGNDPIVNTWRLETLRSRRGGIAWDVHGLLPLLDRYLKRIEEENARLDAMNKEADPSGKRHKHRLLRTYSLLPTKCGFTASYVKFDSTALLGMIKQNIGKVDLEQTVEHEGKSWTLRDCLRKKLKDEASSPFIVTSHLWWRRFFNLEHIDKGDQRFHRELTTDGYGVSILTSRPTRNDRKPKKTEPKPDAEERDGYTFAFGLKLHRQPQQLSRQDYGIVWGIDPGRTDFITATSSEGKTVRFRLSSYRSASGQTKAKSRSNREIDRDPAARELLRQVPTKKTPSLATFAEHVQFLFQHRPALLAFFMKPVFRMLRFRRFTQRNKQLDRACYKLAVGDESKPTLVAFGDCGAAGKDVIKNCPAGPVQLLCKKLATKCEVVAVDEYLTSQVHRDCGAMSRMKNHLVWKKCKDGKTRRCSVHKVLHCLRKDGGCGRSVDRDVNASKNILDVVLWQLAGKLDRPDRLRRTAP